MESESTDMEDVQMIGEAVDTNAMEVDRQSESNNNELEKKITELENKLINKNIELESKISIINEMESKISIINEMESKISKINELESKIIELENKNIKLENEIIELINKNNGTENKFKDLENKNDELKKRMKNNRNKLKDENNELEKKNNELEKKNNELEIKNNELENRKGQNIIGNAFVGFMNFLNPKENPQTDRQKLEELLNLRNKKIDDLLKDNDDLKKEAIKYQSALGDATSFQLGSQDSNSAGQLSKDIGNLHKKLEKFCGLKKGIEVNESGVKELLRKFGCSIADNKIHNSKNLISGVLERHVIETIIEKTQNYLKNDKDNKQSLEVKMVKTTERLSKLTHSISIKRTGTDEVSKATSTKLRQQIYGVLGNRGFSNIIVDKEDKKHPFIATLQKDILDLMNCYRTITNLEKLSEIESMIDEIVRQVVSIFFFRLKVQEPVANWKFFEYKTSINTIMMEAPWDENELEDLHVDICAFPIIGSNLCCEADKVDKNLKVIFKAQIITNNLTTTRSC